MKAIALFFLVTLVGCGHQVDYRLAPHIEAFRAAAAKRGVDVSTCSLSAVVVDEIASSDHTMGECVGVLSPEIRISREMLDGFYGALTGYTEYVVFHELGHCWLGLEHDGDTLMQATASPPVGWSAYREKELDKLFAKYQRRGCATVR